MRISTIIEAIENASGGDGTTAKRLSEMSGASVRECRETLRELHSAGIVNREGNSYHLNTESYHLETIVRCISKKRGYRRNG